MKSTAVTESIDAMVRECRGFIRNRGRDAVFASLSRGEWVLPMGSRLVSVKALDAWEFMGQCSGLTDDEVGEYLAYACASVCLTLLDRKGRAFFGVPGTSTFTLMLCMKPFAETKKTFSMAFDEEEADA